MQQTPRDRRFEFVVLDDQRARQLLYGALPRDKGRKKITIAQRGVLGRKVEKPDEKVWQVPCP